MSNVDIALTVYHIDPSIKDSFYKAGLDIQTKKNAMEGGSGDPYEEQLLAVFNSCLEDGNTELRADGLHNLCDKLQLEERTDELISYLSKQHETFVNFKTFRDGLLKLLGQSHGELENSNTKVKDDDSLQQSTIITGGFNKYGHRSLVSQNESPKHLTSRVNGAMNGKIDHSEMCGVSRVGYPTVPKEMLEQIFEKLDMDCDGLISFDEFILLFENEKNTHEQLNLEWGNGSSNDVIKSRDGQNIVHILGPHQTGYARISTIVSMWEVAGVSDAATLLSHLGFTDSEIRLSDLTTVLCEELKSLRDEPDNAITSTHMSLLKGALTLYQEEVRCMNTLVEHLSGERDKLRIDVAEANERANLLAQEIDEHHVRLEKSWQDQLKQLEVRHAEITRDLAIQCSSEREAHTAALKELDRQLQVVQQGEQQARISLANVLQENQSLEIEVETLTDKIAKLELSNSQLMVKVQHLAAEHDEVDSRDDTKESEQIILLVERIRRLQDESAVLRDQNDELSSEIEFMKNRSLEIKSFDTRDSNSSASLGATANPPDELGTMNEQQSEESADFAAVSANGWCKNVAIEVDDTKLSHLSNIIGSIVRELKSLLNKKTQCTSDYCAFRSNISNIITGLETNLSRVSATKFSDEESGEEKDNELEVECEERTTESLRDLVVSQAEKTKLIKRTSHSDDMINNIDKNFNNLDVKTIAKNKITSLRDYPPRKDDPSSIEQSRIEKEKINIPLNVTQTLSGDTDDLNKHIREMMNEILQEQEAKHIIEKKQLSERCAELERSLDLLRTEYEQCEDYWAAKLEEERQLFEQEQKISDDKFSELITKMAEYEEQFSPGEKARNDGRLSPIEEKFNLEQQYTDLEDEYEEFKTQTTGLISQKDGEIKELQERLSNAIPTKCTKVDASTQFSFDNTAIECSFKPTIHCAPLPHTQPIHSTSESHSCSVSGISNSAGNKKLIHYGTNNHKVFDPSKLNQIAESTVANEGMNQTQLTRHRDCYCQQIEAYTSMEELCRVHKAELHRLYQKKLEIDSECLNLKKQKESLTKGVLELQNYRSHGRLCPEGEVDESTCRMNISVLKTLNEQLQAQEKKRRNLKISLTHQQHHAERILQQTWQQHCHEVAALQFALQNTKEKLKQQIQTNEKQADRLAKADMLSKDLYVENAYLTASIKQLEQHFHISAQFGSESTSV